MIFKEAINNTCKYSQAVNCRVEIIAENNKLFLRINDDGVGITKPTNGNGLKNMQQRAEELGGEFILGCQGGKGVAITVIIPVPNISDSD